MNILNTMLLLSLLCFSTNSLPVDLNLSFGPLTDVVVKTDCKFDTRKKICQIDTGASISFLEQDSFFENYQIESTITVGGAIGGTTQADGIFISELFLGNSKFNNQKVYVVRNPNEQIGNVIGMDLLRQKSLHFDFKNRKLLFDNIPNSLTKYSFKSSRYLEIQISVKFKQQRYMAIWDTGAPLTVINSEIVKNNPNHFEFITDVSTPDNEWGGPFNMKVYVMKNMIIGKYSFDDFYVLGMNFTSIQEDLGNEVNFLIGANMIVTSGWYFDMEQQLWAIY